MGRAAGPQGLTDDHQRSTAAAVESGPVLKHITDRGEFARTVFTKASNSSVNAGSKQTPASMTIAS